MFGRVPLSIDGILSECFYAHLQGKNRPTSPLWPGSMRPTAHERQSVDGRSFNHGREKILEAGEGEFLRTVTDAVLQLLMEADVQSLIGVLCNEDPAEHGGGRAAPNVPPAGVS